MIVFKEFAMDNTKELNLQETKEKLKKVASHWVELTELSKSAIFDINDPSANWNKEIQIADLENADEIKVTEQPKPEKLSEEPPKKPKIKDSTFSIVLIVFFSLVTFSLLIQLFTVYDGLPSLFGIDMTAYILSSTITFIVINMFAIGLMLLRKNLIASKCKKIIEKINLIISANEEKFIKRYSKKGISILSTIFLVISPILLSSCISITNYSSNLVLCTVLIFFSVAMILIGVAIIFKHKNKFLLDQLNYKVALNKIEENKKFNQEEYPKLLQAYVDNINNTHKKISEIYKQIEEIDIVSKSQAKYAQMLLDCIYNGAESVKEAFRVLEPHIAELEKQDKIKNKSNKNNIKGEENMIYNKTKRILELVAAIFALVIGIGMLGASLYLFATGIMLASVFAAVGMISLALPFLIPGILLLAISICSIVFGALLIKSPVRPEGVLNTKSKQICLIIFSILSGNIVSFVLEIIVVCLPNFVDPNKYTEKTVSSKYIQPNPQNTQPQPTLQSQYAQPSGVEGKINELKHLKELGVIDEQAYSRAVDKIISEIK